MEPPISWSRLLATRAAMHAPLSGYRHCRQMPRSKLKVYLKSTTYEGENEAFFDTIISPNELYSMSDDWLTAQPIAHRGLHDASVGVIENTAAAFSAAMAAGYGIETDL